MQLLLLPLILKGTTHFALLDSGASDSFISADVVKQAGLRPIEGTNSSQSGKCPILERVAICAGDSGCGNPAPEALHSSDHQPLIDV